MRVHRLHDRIAVGRWQWLSLAIGILASAACVIGAVFDPGQFFRAYLFTYLFLLGLALGGLALVMIHHLIGGAWGVLTRRLSEAQMNTLPLITLLFVPIAFGLPYIYLWADPAVQTRETHRTIKGWYLEPDFFLWRAAAYFAIWLSLAWFLSAWSRRLDEATDARTAWKLSKLSGAGLLLLGVTLHFAAIDWIMSLQTQFTSTIFGPLVFSSQILSAYALVVVLFCWLIQGPQFEELLSGKVLNDLGSLLLTLLGLWAYMAWFQFMLVWMADLPRGTVWYLARMGGGWRWLIGIIVCFGLVVPFFLLLLRAIKQTRPLLMSVAATVFVGQLLFVVYQVLPAFDATEPWQHWMDLLMPFGLGGIWFACFLWLLSRGPLLPLYDLNYPQVIRLREAELEEAAREEALSHA